MEEDSSDIFGKLGFSQPLSGVLKAPSNSPQKQYERNDNVIQELTNLSKAKDRFKQFLDILKEHKRTPIRQDIVNYCGEQKKSQKVIENYPRPQTLLKKMDIRIEKMIKTRRLKKNWGQEDLKILVWVISKYCDYQGYSDLEKDITDEDWKMISSYIPGVTPETCMFKWLSIKKVTLATYKWLESQSNLLQRIVVEKLAECSAEQATIKDWKEVSQELYRINEQDNKVYRNAKQCKEHWNCHLNPELKKGLWQPQQDIKLLKFIRDNKGQKKWSQLSRHFDGRTENALKNRHKLIVQKLQKQVKNKYKEELQLISEYLEKLMVDQLTTNIRTQPEPIFDSNSEIKVEYDEEAEVYPQQRQFELLQDTTDSAITPSRVQKFNLCNFRTMDLQFLRTITPGTICSDGTFKKVIDRSGDPVLSSMIKEEEIEEVIEIKKTKGPFSVVPLTFDFYQR